MNPKTKVEYHVTIIERDGTIMQCVKRTRKEALRETSAAENVRNCLHWKITFYRPSINLKLTY